MQTTLLQIASRAALLSLLIIPVASAQDIEEGDAIVVTGEVPQLNQVSGFKTDTPIIDVPQSLSIFGKEQISEQGIDSIGDIIDYTPGVVNSQGEGHRDSVVFRGIRTTADFFINGVRDDVQYYRSLYNVEKVEILRGPNALTFGRGGVGGVLNRVLKKAEIGEDFGEIQGSINTFGATYGQFDYNWSLSDNAAFRLNVFNENLENHRDFFDGERIGINPNFTWEINEDTSLNLSYEYSDHERFIDRGIPSGPNGRPASALSGTTFGDSVLNETTLEAHVFRATLEHNFSDSWKGKLTGSYGTYDKVYQNYFPTNLVSSVNPGENRENGFNPANGLVSIDGYVDRTDRQNFVLSGDLVGEFSTGGIGHKLLIGAEYTNTSSDQDRLNNVFEAGPGQPLQGLGSPTSSTPLDIAAFPADGLSISNGVVTDADGNVLATGTLSDPNDDTRVTIDTYSFFLQDEIAINDHFDVILGARFDSFDIKVFNALNGETRSRRDNEVSPRIGLVYKPVENISLYASYSETFLPRSGEQFANINGDNDQLEPDTFSNLEAGLKWDVNDDFGLALAAFQINARSPQLSTNTNDGSFDVIETETFGFELQAQGQITDWWHVSAGYSYLDGEQSNGDVPREQPEHTFSMWNSFTVNEKFGLGLGFIFQDESFADNENTTILPSYVRVDAAAYYNISDTLKLQVNVENLLDRDYFPSAHTENNITVGAPINASIKLTKTF